MLGKRNIPRERVVKLRNAACIRKDRGTVDLCDVYLYANNVRDRAKLERSILESEREYR